MSVPRVLIDTNVLLSGLIWNGNESHLLEMATSGDIRLLIPKFVINEARRVLAAKFPVHAHLLDEALNLLDYEVLASPSSHELESAQAVLRDPNDAEVLASIIESRPDYAVTGDKDLLTADVRAIFPTCTCVDFLRQVTD
jgi:uncharacterized protein